MRNVMNASTMNRVARVFRDGTLAGMSDRQVLERFAAHSDESAFETILSRHGPMVRNVCRQILLDPHDVDDAVQAVFLALVQKARAIRVDDSLGPWLYTVAGRVAARARANRRKRWTHESAQLDSVEPAYSLSADCSELPAIIHDELRRLPERLRCPSSSATWKASPTTVPPVSSAARSVPCAAGSRAAETCSTAESRDEDWPSQLLHSVEFSNQPRQQRRPFNCRHRLSLQSPARCSNPLDPMESVSPRRSRH